MNIENIKLNSLRNILTMLKELDDENHSFTILCASKDKDKTLKTLVAYGSNDLVHSCIKLENEILEEANIWRNKEIVELNAIEKKLNLLHYRKLLPLLVKVSTGRQKCHWTKPSFKPAWWPTHIVPWGNVRSDLRNKEQRQLQTSTEALRAATNACFQYYNCQSFVKPWITPDKNDVDSVPHKLTQVVKTFLLDVEKEIFINEQTKLARRTEKIRRNLQVLDEYTYEDSGLPQLQMNLISETPCNTKEAQLTCHSTVPTPNTNQSQLDSFTKTKNVETFYGTNSSDNYSTNNHKPILVNIIPSNSPTSTLTMPGINDLSFDDDLLKSSSNAYKTNNNQLEHGNTVWSPSKLSAQNQKRDMGYKSSSNDSMKKTKQKSGKALTNLYTETEFSNQTISNNVPADLDLNLIQNYNNNLIESNQENSGKPSSNSLPSPESTESNQTILNEFLLDLNESCFFSVNDNMSNVNENEKENTSCNTSSNVEDSSGESVRNLLDYFEVANL